MTAVERLRRYIFKGDIGECWHGTNSVERGDREAAKGRAEVALAVGVMRQNVYTWKRLCLRRELQSSERDQHDHQRRGPGWNL